MNEDYFKKFKEIKNNFTLNILQAISATVIVIICFQIIASIIQLPAFFKPVLNHLTLPLSFLVGGVLAITTIIHLFKIDFQEIKNHLKKIPNIGLFSLSILIYFATIPFAEYVSNIIPTTGNTLIEELYKLFSEGLTVMLSYEVAGFITVCILAPILEEIIFRGLLLRGLLQGKTNPAIAIILSGILFGVAHLNLWQFIGAGLLGVVFGFIYYRTKSLLLCVFLHALNNIISFIFLMNTKNLEEGISNNIPIPYIFGGLILAIIFSIFLHKKTTIQWT